MRRLLPRREKRTGAMMPLCSPTKPLSLLCLPIIFLILLSSPALAQGRHVVAFRSPGLRPSSLLWDPGAQHFLVGSLRRPVVTSVSDAGVLETVVTDPDLPAGSFFPSVALDIARRLLVAVVSGSSPLSPAYLAAYDLRSPRPHLRVFLSRLPSPHAEPANPANVVVDLATGVAYVTSSTQNIIWKVDPQGKASVFSRSEAYGKHGHRGLAGIAHVGKGYLLAVQAPTGKVFKVDAEDGTARMVLIGGKKEAAGLESIAVRSDGSAAVAGGRVARIVMSDDGWGEAGWYDEVPIGDKEGGRACAVAVREGRRVYVLIVEDDEGSLDRIEELEWERDKEGEWVVGLVLVGLGLVYFLYWRFQMGRLVSGISKKRL